VEIVDFYVVLDAWCDGNAVAFVGGVHGMRGFLFSLVCYVTHLREVIIAIVVTVPALHQHMWQSISCI
jgi:hypothetical protein